jgi:hypothetical protein
LFGFIFELEKVFGRSWHAVFLVGSLVILGPRFFFLMDGFWNPIDSSGIVGFPHDIPEDVIDNIPEFFDHNHPGADIVELSPSLLSEWCDPPIHEDVLMQIICLYPCCDERGSRLVS